MNKSSLIKKYDSPGKGTVLQPLGHSPNLTEEERREWDEWNGRVARLAGKMQDSLYISGCREEKVVSLSFDDAPDSKNTPEILNILKEFGVKANFSFVGVYVEELPGIAGRIFEEGHLILNHTWEHRSLVSLKEEELEEEVMLAENEIFKSTGKRPALLRPPYGAINEKVVSWLDKKGFATVLWSLNTFDWLEKAKDNIIKNVEENVRPGDIILMHSYEHKEPTVEALPEIISLLKEKGYRFADAAEMLGIKPYKNSYR